MRLTASLLFMLFMSRKTAVKNKFNIKKYFFIKTLSKKKLVQ
jgi:hypothetical protein